MFQGFRVILHVVLSLACLFASLSENLTYGTVLGRQGFPERPSRVVSLVAVRRCYGAIHMNCDDRFPFSVIHD